jgi:hypothetical protein
MKFRLYQQPEQIKNLINNKSSQGTNNNTHVLTNRVKNTAHNTTTDLLEQVMSGLAWNG